MAEDQSLGANITGPMEAQGVQSLDDSAVVIRAKMMVRAGTQWGLKREFNRRMKNRFDELGIEIPFPHRTVYFGKEKDHDRNDPPPSAFVRAPARPSSDAGDADGD
jgi:small conductance mechanosensitive channel